MDFGQLLHTAQKNEKVGKNEVRYYSTKFEPPKKEKKEGKELSANIKKFLERKEAEERRKAEEAKKKKEELLALRAQDKKATRRVNVMLKRTKSANQSVIEDAVDNDNTAVTLAGPMQPDEDDYGYVSQEASAFYNKMMEKYSKIPEEPKFSLTKKKVSTNLSSTKDRVKAALEKEREEAMLPHKRKRKHKEHKDNEEGEEGLSYTAPDRNVNTSSPPPSTTAPPPSKPKPKAAPPPLNFAELLKIAEKKQFEPILIEKKEKEDERLLTKRQRKEIDKERESLQRREARREAERRGIPPPDKATSSNRIPKVGEKMGPPPPPPPDKAASSNRIPKANDKLVKPPSNDRIDKIPKFDGQKPLKSSLDDQIPKASSSHSSAKPSLSKPISSTSINNPPQKASSSSLDRNEKLINSTKNGVKFSKSPLPSSSNVKPGSRDQENIRQGVSNVNISKDKPKSLSNSLNDKPKEFPPKDLKSKKFPPEDLRSKKLLPNDIRARKMYTDDNRPKKLLPDDVKAKQFPPNDLKPRQYLPNDLRAKQLPPNNLKSKQFPPRDLKPKQFPPPDVRRKEFPPRGVKKPVIGSKRPILDDDSEYDSEMDDFIDDDDQEGDYSKYISEIFGYDKSRYRDVDDDVDNMESTFAQQMREEVISTKIGIMEDLEDMRQEEEEKKRKALMKKRKL